MKKCRSPMRINELSFCVITLRCGIRWATASVRAVWTAISKTNSLTLSASCLLHSRRLRLFSAMAARLLRRLSATLPRACREKLTCIIFPRPARRMHASGWKIWHRSGRFFFNIYVRFALLIVLCYNKKIKTEIRKQVIVSAS